MLKNKLLRACTVLRLTKERLNGCELSGKIVAFTPIIVSNLGNFTHSKRLQLKNPLALLFANLISFKTCSLQKPFHWCQLSWLLVLPPYLPVPLPIRGNHWCPHIPWPSSCCYSLIHYWSLLALFWSSYSTFICVYEGPVILIDLSSFDGFKNRTIT